MKDKHILTIIILLSASFIILSTLNSPKPIKAPPQPTIAATIINSPASISFNSQSPAPLFLEKIEIELAATPTANLKLSTNNQNLGNFKFEKWRKNKQVALLSLKLSPPLEITDQDFSITSPQTFSLLDADFTIKDPNNQKANLTAIRFIDQNTFQYLDESYTNIDEVLSKHSFLSLDPNTPNQLVINPGTYTITQTVIIPRDLKLVISPGTTLRFTPNTSLVSYSQVTALGTNTAPITFTGSTSSPWGVFAVIGKNASGSQFKHANLSGASNAYINGAFFSGGLAIHYADVTISDSRFSNNTGDDGLNIKNFENFQHPSYFSGFGHHTSLHFS